MHEMAGAARRRASHDLADTKPYNELGGFESEAVEGGGSRERPPSLSISLDSLQSLGSAVLGVGGIGGSLAVVFQYWHQLPSAHTFVYNAFMMVSAVCVVGVAFEVLCLIGTSAHMNYRRSRTHALISKKFDDSVAKDDDGEDDGESTASKKKGSSPRSQRIETYERQTQAMNKSMWDLTKQTAMRCSLMTLGAVVFRLIAVGDALLPTPNTCVSPAEPCLPVCPSFVLPCNPRRAS